MYVPLLLISSLNSAYPGKDSRYAMEQNVVPTTAGDQESDWLYSQTNSLRQLGAKLTYSGDSPFLLRLVIGVSNEQSSDTVSWLPLYVSNDTTDFRPLTCEPETGKRTELNVPFRKKNTQDVTGQHRRHSMRLSRCHPHDCSMCGNRFS